jgi:hypothetical protein
MPDGSICKVGGRAPLVETLGALSSSVSRQLSLSGLTRSNQVAQVVQCSLPGGSVLRPLRISGGEDVAFRVSYRRRANPPDRFPRFAGYSFFTEEETP